jgi:hypothetical protein
MPIVLGSSDLFFVFIKEGKELAFHKGILDSIN